MCVLGGGVVVSTEVLPKVMLRLTNDLYVVISSREAAINIIVVMIGGRGT